MQAVISEVDMHCFPAMARWIHPQMQTPVFLQLLETNIQRLTRYRSPHPLQALVDEERVAAAYFTLLPGQVATLGGVRSLDGFEPTAVSIVERLAYELKFEMKLGHIQATLAVDDLIAQRIIAASGFKPLATVQHLWCFGNTVQKARKDKTTISPGVQWLPARDLSSQEMGDFIAATFVDTLDCPALNGRRSSCDVLESFLDGQPLSSMANWELLELDGQIAGCLLLKHYDENHVTELEYMAILPELRGRQLGELLINRTFEQAHKAKADVVVVAVDEQNSPALNLYHRTGFSHHTSWSVWIYE